MKSLRFNRINGLIVLLLLVVCFAVFAISGKLTSAHADVTNVMLTVKFAHPVRSVQIVSVEGGMNPICLTLPHGKTQVTTTVGSGLPINVLEFTQRGCKGSVYNVNYTESGPGGTSLTIYVP